MSECVRKGYKKCDANLVPKDYPDTTEELLTACK